MARDPRQSGPRGRLSLTGGHVSPLGTLRLVTGGIAAFDRQRQRTKAEAEHRAAVEALDANIVSGRLQHASLATPQDMIAAGLSIERYGLYCGVAFGQSVFNATDRHQVFLGGSATGKSSRSAMTIITSLGLAGEAAVILDFKTELSWCTSEGRTQIDGEPSLHYAPFGSAWAQSISINPLDDVIDRARRGLPVSDLARQKGSLIFSRLDEMGANKWIGESARGVFLTLLNHYAELEPDKCWLGHLSDVGAWSMNQTIEELRLIALHSTASNGLAADLARTSLRDFGVEIFADGSTSEPTDKGCDAFKYAMKEYWERLAPFAKGGAARQYVQHTSFDVAELKQKSRALYINIPPAYLKSHAGFIAILVQYMIDRVAMAPGAVRVSFLLDEFGQLPAIPNMMTALRLYRDYGVRLVIFGQDPASFDAYKKEGGYEPFKASSISILSGQTDGKLLRDLQEQAGYRADLVRSRSAQAGASYDQGGLGVTEQLSPVLPISKIRQIGLGQCLWDVQGMPLAIATLPLCHFQKTTAPVDWA